MLLGFNKYHYSYIYKIVCLDPNIDDFYIGSTVNLNIRCQAHIKTGLNKKNLHYHYKLYTFIRDSGGYENWEMQVIKLYKCETKRELVKEEQKYIDELKPSLNTDNAYSTEEYNKEIKKKWQQDNREKQNERAKKRYQDNKEIEKIKIECECGSVIRKRQKQRHNRSEKHQAYLNNLST